MVQENIRLFAEGEINRKELINIELGKYLKNNEMEVCEL